MIKMLKPFHDEARTHPGAEFERHGSNRVSVIVCLELEEHAWVPSVPIEIIAFVSQVQSVFSIVEENGRPFGLVVVKE
jgi:hypothetical protein